ncbi:MAG TPA: ketopantoate reductase family protein [Terriglobales bacterium]|nr:ketopantoate reductase family protein [Terriglobales bacterium]
MTVESNWPRVAVVGAGAVGGYFGGLLANAGAPVVMIARQAFVDAVSRAGLFLDTLQFQKRVRVDASTDLSSVRGADLVLFSVKTTDNAATARLLVPFLAPQAIVVSVQNGVDNVDEIRAVAGIDAVAAVVYVAASVEEPGHVKHVGRGDLVIGPESEKVKGVAEIFLRAKVPCRVTNNIEGELWTKLLWNCALNAVSALGEARYGTIAASREACQLVKNVVDEVLAVARAAHVLLPGIEDSKAAVEGVMKIATQMAGALSSTAQDIQRGKPTEIASLNGYIVRRGVALGVATPVNQALYALVKLREGH